MKETLKAAIYARKSTDDNDKIPDAKSVARQVEHAKQYAAKKGWTVDEQHIYVDDNVSGANYARRFSFHRLEAAVQRGEFAVIVASEPSRLGRAGREDINRLTDILEAGVRVFYYLDDKEERCDTFEGEAMLYLNALVAKQERLRISQRSRDGGVRSARKGHNAGGRVYGYDNHQVFAKNAKGEQVRSHTEYRINEREAEVIRAIFAMRRDGHGLKTIAKSLNGDPVFRAQSQKYFGGTRVPAPRKGSGSWAPSGVRALLRNERYTGVIPYGKYRKARRKGKNIRMKQPEYEKVPAPHLRVVDHATWLAVQATLQRQHARPPKEFREQRKRMNGGRRGWSAPSSYLLSSLAQCPECGASIVGTMKSWGSGAKRRQVAFYRCSFNLNRGSTVCGNNHTEQADAITKRVLAAIEEAVLNPAALDFVVDKASALCVADKVVEPTRKATLKMELDKKRRALEKYVGSFADLDIAPSELVAEIERRKGEIRDLEKELANAEPSRVPTAAELRQIRKELRRQARRFKRTLRGNVTGARAALRQLLVEPLKFHPVVRDGRKAFRFEGRTVIGALLDPVCVQVASPRGFEPRLPP